MLKLRPANARGGGNHGWLETRHTFSFSDYRDPNHMGFRVLRVMNEDRVGPGQGFGMHPHRDMEILTYVLSGALEHRDSLGNGSVLKAGEFQRMTAGTGIQHSEFNPSPTDAVHLYQIWLFPERKNLEPSYDQKAYAVNESQGRLRLVASRDQAEGSLLIHQDAKVYLGILTPGETVVHELASGRHAWVQLLRGVAVVNGQMMEVGDGLAANDESRLSLQANESAEVMLFDLP